MATFVSADWVEEHINRPGYLLIDPRSAMRYLMGHLRGAVSVPLKKLQDEQGRLRPTEELAETFAAAGLGDDVTPVLYDGSDGRNAAMHAWILEYLGRDDIHIMDLLYDHWKDQGREVLYRPVSSEAGTFTPQVRATVRASVDDAAEPGAAKLLDTRSVEEYRGEVEIDQRPGHIPGSIHLAWNDLAGADGRLLIEAERLQQALASVGISPDDSVIAYCRSGLRASLPYLAMKQAGYNVRLYDGSYVEWMMSGNPIEI
jgi:thiosulfate/3-mercaptopyruvate sulfurtransferase